jgi:predicted enzyme related to lactoylglutathione lyase
MIKGFSFASVWSSDLNNLLPFYRDTLGLKPSMESEGFVVFGDPAGVAFGLGSHSDVSGKNTDPARHMVGFNVEDIQGMVQQLKGKGVEFVEEPNDQGGGFWIATLKDPEGNLVQLFEGTPPAP